MKIAEAYHCFNLKVFFIFISMEATMLFHCLMLYQFVWTVMTVTRIIWINDLNKLRDYYHKVRWNCSWNGKLEISNQEIIVFQRILFFTFYFLVTSNYLFNLLDLQVCMESRSLRYILYDPLWQKTAIRESGYGLNKIEASWHEE